MEGNGKLRERRPKRCYQCNRLENQLWESAYDRLWPIVRVSLTKRLKAAKGPGDTLRIAKGGSRHG